MQNQNSSLFHIIRESDWKQALDQGTYSPPSIKTEGFIHLSTETQYQKSAQRFYAGQKNLILLEVNPSLFEAELKYEKVHEGEDPFPHLFGAMNLNAVIKIHHFEEQDDRTWKLSPYQTAK